MTQPELNTIYFVNKFGSEKKQFPFPVAPNIKLMDIVPEISKKFGVSSQNVCIANMGGQVLTATDMLCSIKELVDKFGNTFDIIDRGIVGSKPKSLKSLQNSTKVERNSQKSNENNIKVES